MILQEELGDGPFVIQRRLIGYSIVDTRFSRSVAWTLDKDYASLLVRALGAYEQMYLGIRT